jgi:hypothetical protein
MNDSTSLKMKRKKMLKVTMETIVAINILHFKRFVFYFIFYYQNKLCINFNSNILLNKCINTISNGIAHQA